MNKKTMGWVLGILALLLIGSGLWFWQGKRTVQSPHKTPEVQVPVKKGPTLTIYYPNRKYMETGNESLPKYLPKKVVIDSQPAFAAVSQLQKVPNDPDISPAIRKDLKILGVRVDKEVAYVNFSSANLYGGSLEETILVQSVVKTLTGIKGVQKVQFLVDGGIRETLMGHIETGDPIGVNDL